MHACLLALLYKLCMLFGAPHMPESEVYSRAGLCCPLPSSGPPGSRPLSGPPLGLPLVPAVSPNVSAVPSVVVSD